MALSVLCGLQLLSPKCLPKVLGHVCQLRTGILAILRHVKWHWISKWTTKPRPRSLLTIMGHLARVDRGTQPPTFKGLVFKLSPAQHYWCYWRREDVQLHVEMQDIFAMGTQSDCTEGTLWVKISDQEEADEVDRKYRWCSTVRLHSQLLLQNMWQQVFLKA